MKALATAALVLTLPALATAGSTVTSGLRGRVVIQPGYPVCKVNQPCVRPAPYVWLVFSRGGRTVARAKTRADGSYRIALRPGPYAVSSPSSKRGRPGLQPPRVTVPVGQFKRVVFTLDLGLQ